MDKHRKRNLMVTVILSVGLVGGCEYTPSQLLGASQNQNQQSPAPAEKPQPAGESGEQAKNDKLEAIKESIKQIPAELVLSPGAKQTLPHADVVTYTSSVPQLVAVSADGTLAVAADAKTGDQATITAAIDGESKQVLISIKATLEDTIAIVNGVATVTNPTDLLVVVNKERSLPDQYIPDNLVEPNVPFSFPGKSEKRLMRADAAKALEQLFAQAKKENITLLGVSGYRSAKTQRALFDSYVKTQGADHASRYSAHSGQSEHQTGLAIDVSGTDSKVRLEEPFADTIEGKWLEQNVAKFGFIIRYPKGKEAITGYAYEPWHIRYVGTEVAEEIMSKGITLEEYFQGVVPVQTTK